MAGLVINLPDFNGAYYAGVAAIGDSAIDSTTYTSLPTNFIAEPWR